MAGKARTRVPEAGWDRSPSPGIPPPRPRSWGGAWPVPSVIRCPSVPPVRKGHDHAPRGMRRALATRHAPHPGQGGEKGAGPGPKADPAPRSSSRADPTGERPHPSGAGAQPARLRDRRPHPSRLPLSGPAGTDAAQGNLDGGTGPEPLVAAPAPANGGHGREPRHQRSQPACHRPRPVTSQKGRGHMGPSCPGSTPEHNACVATPQLLSSRHHETCT